MRTVSFSEPRVQNLLNQNFVNTFSNTRGDPTAGKSIKHRPSDPPGQCIRGNGKQNVQTIFLTPTGEIFHVATGFLSPDDLLEESSFALQIFDQLKNSDSDKSSFVAEKHRERLAGMGFKNSDINAQSDMARMMNMINGNTRSRSNRSPIGGSSSRNSLQGINVFQQFIDRQLLEDNQFSIKYPLMSYRQLERDPTRLVGNGQSFFASSSSSN